MPGESLRVPLSWVLRDPWSAGVRSLIRRERVAGYERSFWSPDRRRVECEAAVYRSVAGARNVFSLRAKRFGAFLADAHMGGRVPVGVIGDATIAYRTERGWKGFVVSWRYRRVLARCGGLGLERSSLREALLLARLQQRRVARSLG